MRAKKLIVGGIAVAALAIGVPAASAATGTFTAGERTAAGKTTVCQYIVKKDSPLLVRDAAGKAVMTTAPKGSVANISWIGSLNNGARIAAGNFYHIVVTRDPHGKPKRTPVLYANPGAIAHADLVAHRNSRGMHYCWSS